ncbi:hypothetical protein EBU71_00935 [bacterium]|nr:hypothetical protein [Candidatus Elulimicrobium humile]
MNKPLLFPTTVVENFYSEPDKIREYALSLEYLKGNGNWPGLRTKQLDLVNQNFFWFTARKFLSVYYDKLNSNDWQLLTFFQKIYPISADKNHFTNRGWIHKDYCALAGILYLTPNPDPDSGTSIFEINNESDMSNYTHNTQDYLESKKKLYRDSILDDDYQSKIENHRKQFTETLEIKNKYNRLVLFDGHCWHGVNTINCNNLPRLTQVFFVEKRTNIETPLERMRNVILS